MAPRAEKPTKELATSATALYSKIHKKSPTKSRPRPRRSTHFTYPGPNGDAVDIHNNHFTCPGPGLNNGYVVDSIIDARRKAERRAEDNINRSAKEYAKYTKKVMRDDPDWEE